MAVSKYTSTVKTLQIFLTLISVILGLVSALSVNWVSTENGDTGLFSYKADGKVKDLDCTSMMSQTQCGFLLSSQHSCIIALIFGFLGLFWLGFQYSYSTPTNALVTFSLAFLQFCFSVTGIVVYKFFKQEYLDADDGVNVEYPVGTYADYEYAFYLWLSVAVFSFLVSGVSAFELYRMTRASATSKYDRDIEQR